MIVNLVRLCAVGTIGMLPDCSSTTFPLIFLLRKLPESESMAWFHATIPAGSSCQVFACARTFILENLRDAQFSDAWRCDWLTNSQLVCSWSWMLALHLRARLLSLLRGSGAGGVCRRLKEKRRGGSGWKEYHSFWSKVCIIFSPKCRCEINSVIVS